MSMGFVDKARAKVEEVVGEFKESVGEAYGNEALELDGEAEAAAAREREAELDTDAPAAARDQDATPATDPQPDDDHGDLPARTGQIP